MSLQERPAPIPVYPPRYPMKRVKLLVIAAYKHKPAPAPLTFAEDVAGEPSADVNVKRFVEAYVRDRQHRDQLRIWAWCHEDVIEGEGRRGRPRLSFQEDSFREQCRERGWNRDTALRNVESALSMVMMMMNWPTKPGERLGQL